MPINLRAFPIVKGKDAEKFLKRQSENRKKLDEKAEQKLKKLDNHK